MLAGFVCCALVAALMGLAAWAGAAIHASDVSLTDMAKASLNTLPLVALFLSVAFLSVAYVPRHTGAVALALAAATLALARFRAGPRAGVGARKLPPLAGSPSV
jgi:hypothetical protein